jgi:hypothetical protein
VATRAESSRSLVFRLAGAREDAIVGNG